jgi:hypothetical protein
MRPGAAPERSEARTRRGPDRPRLARFERPGRADGVRQASPPDHPRGPPEQDPGGVWGGAPEGDGRRSRHRLGWPVEAQVAPPQRAGGDRAGTASRPPHLAGWWQAACRAVLRRAGGLLATRAMGFERVEVGGGVELAGDVVRIVWAGGTPPRRDRNSGDEDDDQDQHEDGQM